MRSDRWDLKLKGQTDVAHFFVIDVSNSMVSCRLSNSALTVRPEPALVRRVVRSSLKTFEYANMIIMQLTTHLVISANFAKRCQLTLHSDGNTLPCSISWFWSKRRNHANLLVMLSSCPASSFVRKIRRYSLSSRATKRSRRWVLTSSPNTSTTVQASAMRVDVAGLLLSCR